MANERGWPHSPVLTFALVLCFISFYFYWYFIHWDVYSYLDEFIGFCFCYLISKDRSWLLSQGEGCTLTLRRVCFVCLGGEVGPHTTGGGFALLLFIDYLHSPLGVTL